MIRSHELCLKISSKKPTDPDYKSLLEELIQCEIYNRVGLYILRIAKLDGNPYRDWIEANGGKGFDFQVSGRTLAQ